MIEVPGVKIFQYKSALYYANVEHFANMLAVCATVQNPTNTVKNTSTFSVNGIDNSGSFVGDGPPENGSIVLKSYEKDNARSVVSYVFSRFLQYIRSEFPNLHMQ